MPRNSIRNGSQPVSLAFDASQLCHWHKQISLQKGCWILCSLRRGGKSFLNPERRHHRTRITHSYFCCQEKRTRCVRSSVVKILTTLTTLMLSVQFPLFCKLAIFSWNRRTESYSQYVTVCEYVNAADNFWGPTTKKSIHFFLSYRPPLFLYHYYNYF